VMILVGHRCAGDRPVAEQCVSCPLSQFIPSIVMLAVVSLQGMVIGFQPPAMPCGSLTLSKCHLAAA